MNRALTPIVALVVGLLLIPAALTGIVLGGPYTQAQAGDQITVGFVGGDVTPSVRTALQLDENSIVLSEFDSVHEALSDSIDTLVIVDTPLGTSDITELSTFLTAGGGLLILLGPEMMSNSTGFQELGITASNNLIGIGDGNAVTRMVETEHPALNFDWSSAPPTRNMTRLPALTAESTILLANDTGFGTSGDPLLVETEVGLGKIFTYTPWLMSDEDSQTNQQLVLWPYYNYFFYSASTYLAGEETYTYAEWTYSPVPHFNEQLIIGLIVIVLGITTGVSYTRMRRKSREDTEVLSEIERAELLVETEEEISEWEEVGMHRQIGGFLIQFFITLLIIIPRVVLTIMVYPVYILPFPQAAGWYSFSVNLFLGLWTVFDLGTSVALAKYFAEYRISKPEEAIKYAQIFVWFQCITGVVQISIVAFAGSILFPHTYLAHLSYVFIGHSLFQFPGFTLLFVHVFRGMNRIDYQQITQILYYAIFTVVIPYIPILIFRVWGASNPIFGEALGGAIGQAIGYYMGEWLTFVISIYLFKKLGFSATTLFRIDFRSEQVKKALKFGAKWTIGAAAVPLVWFYQMILISTNLLNWSALQGQYQLAWDLAIIVQVVGLFMEGMLGGISEAHSHAKKKLTALYNSLGLKWGAFFTFWLVSGLAAVGSRAILGAAGPEWAYAAELLGFFLVFQVIGFWSWLGDWVFAGAERPGLAASVWILEQVLRAIFMTFLVLTEPVIFGIYLGGMPGIITGYALALVVKDIAVWILVRRYIAAPKFYVWQSYIGPAIAALVNFFILEFIAQMIWVPGDMISSALIFFIAVVPSLYVFAFISGITGTWDKNTLSEFDRASKMVTMRGVGWLARRFYGAAALGARISPLHDRFPIDIYDEAMKEAKELTREKKQLVI